ncbi:MAG: SRPBCC family protein [Cryobacterium sp.]|nr:SRPBCC family protein [Oligoflexia bacterium]
MATATLTKVLDIPRDKLFAAIAKFEDYPQFVTGVKKTEVERKAPGHARVKYFVNMLGKDLWYLLEHTEDAASGDLTWKLIESDLLKKDSGTWKLRDAGEGKTEVTYTIDIEFKIWIPGPILKGLTTTTLPTLIGEYEKRAKAVG